MWPDSDETQQLLRQAADGSDGAVNNLMNRHRQSLQQMIQLRMDRVLAQRVDASDIVQDVLIEANQRLENYIQNPAMPFHLWLRQLAKDRIIDMHRRHRVAQRRSVDREKPMVSGGDGERSAYNLANDLRDQGLTPAAANIRKELEQRFLLALDELGEDDREVILMRHVEHLGNSEVAQALGLSPAAAGMRYLRALRKLRKMLGEEVEEAE